MFYNVRVISYKFVNLLSSVIGAVSLQAVRVFLDITFHANFETLSHMVHWVCVVINMAAEFLNLFMTNHRLLIRVFLVFHCIFKFDVKEFGDEIAIVLTVPHDVLE